MLLMITYGLRLGSPREVRVILVIKITYVSVSEATSLRIDQTKFSKALMNAGVVQIAKMNTTVRTKLCSKVLCVYSIV